MHGITDENNYKAIANAIREKNGSDTQYLPSEMADAIGAMRVGSIDFGVSFSNKINDFIKAQIQPTIELNSEIIKGGMQKYLYSTYLYITAPIEGDLREVFLGSSIYFVDCPYIKESISGAGQFSGCSQLLYFKADTSLLTKFQSFFLYCYNLEYVEMDLANANICSAMFGACQKLKTAKLGSIKKATQFNVPFTNCLELENLEFDEWVGLDIIIPYSPLLSIQSVNYIIEHALGEADGATARTLTLHATAKANWQDTTKNPDYEYYAAMATEKLITIA